MRDLRLARRQFFGGLFCLAAAAIGGYFVLLPQYHLYQSLNASPNTLVEEQSKILKTLPRVQGNEPNALEEPIFNQLQLDSDAAKTVILQSQFRLDEAQSIDDLPDYIKAIPVTLVANGSYQGLQNFISRMIKRFPYITIKLLRLKSLNTQSVKPEESPILEARLELDIYVYSP